MRVDTKERERGTYLGSHEVAALVGANPWDTPADIYARMVLNAPRKRQTPAMLAGHIIEHGLIAHAEGELGTRLERDCYYRDDEAPYLAGSADGVAGDVLVEVTTCSEGTRGHWGTPEIGNPSPMKAVQVQWLMRLSGARRARVLCLDLSTRDLLGYWCEYDAQMADTLRATALAFWSNHIEAKVPPSAIDGWGTPEHLDLVWPGNPEVAPLAADDEVQRWAREYDHARAVAKEAEERKSRARTHLHSCLAEHTKAVWDGGSVSLSPAGPVREEIDWQRVALSLRDATGVSQGAFQQLISACVERVPGSTRRINVKIKKEGV